MKNKCESCNGCNKNKHRDEETKKKLNKRLRTIEGQIRGIEKMIEEDDYCYDVLIQLLAINKSIKSISKEIVKNHLSTCSVNAIKAGNTEAIEDVMDLIDKIN